MVNQGTPDITRPALSARLRDETADVHEAAERSPFMSRLLEGELPLDAYVGLLTQYRAIYGALEDAAGRLREDPVVRVFARAELDRGAALAADIEALGDDRSRDVEPTVATIGYVERITEACADWPGGFVAHHYVRYMGDLSGGQILRRILGRHYGLTDDRGLSFYRFERIDNGVQFKKDYRLHLDAAPWTPAQQDRIVDEARRAFECNIAVFDSLDAATRVPASSAEPA